MAGHKYIDKIIKNGKARYFYTMEELNAYKKALSSRDEERKFLKVNGVKSNKDSSRRNNINTAYARTIVAKGNASKARKNTKVKSRSFGEIVKKNSDRISTEQDYKRRKRAMDDYERSKTAKGKAEDVKKVFDKYHPETAKKIEKGKKKVDRVVKEMKGYKNALSSKDEADKYIKSAYGKDTKVTNKNRDKLVNKTNKDVKKVDKYLYKDGWDEYYEYTDPKLMKQYRKVKKNKADYESAKTLKGKKEDFTENYRKYHPKKKK